MDFREISQLIDERQAELYQLLSKLVQINSENFGTVGNEQACAEYVRERCLELGLETDLYSPLSLEGFENHPDYYPGRNLEKRYNVTAVWPGQENRNELMLMAHLDTVEIGDPANWSFEPLSGKIEDGKIFGRGACDDKYALAASLFVIRLLKECGFAPKANLVFAAYSDEEHGGSHGALATVLKYPTNCIVSMDGRDGQIWHCASGGGEIIYRFHTAETVDSSGMTARGIPVVMDVIEKFAENRRKELEQNRFYAGTVIPETSLRYIDIHAGVKGTDLGIGEVKFVFYTDKTRDEIWDELAALERELAAKLVPLGLIGDGFIPDTRFFHYGYSEPDNAYIRELTAASEEAIGKAPLVCGSCLSDLSVIMKYGGSNAFGFGAGRDFASTGGAHQPNEFIECSELLDYTKVVAAYILRLLG